MVELALGGIRKLDQPLPANDLLQWRIGAALGALAEERDKIVRQTARRRPCAVARTGACGCLGWTARVNPEPVAQIFRKGPGSPRIARGRADSRSRVISPPWAAPQRMCAFSSIASKAGVRYLGELLMIWMISVVAPIVALALDLDHLFTKGRIGEEVDEIAVTALAAHSLLCGHHGDRFLAIAGHDLRAVADRFVDKRAEVGAGIFELPRANRLGHVVLHCSTEM